MLIVFGHRAMVSKVEDFRPTLLGKEITPAAFAKVLGVILDSCLTNNDYIASTVSSCMTRLGQVNLVKHAIDTTTLTIIIIALAISVAQTTLTCALTQNVSAATYVYAVRGPFR